MRIDINLASQPYQDARRFWRQWGSGLALLALMTALLAFLAITGFLRAQGDRHEMARLQSEIAAYDAEKMQAIALLNQPQNRQMREQAHFLNQLFERKALSWTRVFEDLERVMPAHLRVLSIHPDLLSESANVEIKLLVGGDSLEQAQDLVKKMENSKRFQGTKIVSERFAASDEQNRGENAQDRVQFEIDALYNPLPENAQTSGGMN